MQVVPNSHTADAKEFVSSVSPKGQITLPLEVRKRLAVKPKDKIVVRVEGDAITIAKAVSLKESFQAIPALATPHSVKELVAIAAEKHAQEIARKGL